MPDFRRKMFKFFFMYVYAQCVSPPVEPEEGVKSAGAGVTRSCVP